MLPLMNLKRGKWVNMSFDLIGFMQIFKGSTFRSLDQIVFTGPCKLRKIFTMKYPLFESSNGDGTGAMLPDKVAFAQNLQYTNQMITFQKIEDQTIMTSYKKKHKHKRGPKVDESLDMDSDEKRQWKTYIKVNKSLDPVAEFRMGTNEFKKYNISTKKGSPKSKKLKRKQVQAAQQLSVQQQRKMYYE